VRLLALSAIIAFRAVTVFVLAFGLATLAAALVTIPLRSVGDIQWEVSISVSMAAAGLVVLAAAVASFMAMPRTADAVRRLPPSTTPLPLPVAGIAISCCVAALWQVPRVMRWFTDNRRAVEALVGTERDPLGLNLVPLAGASALPAITMLALLTFALAALLVLTTRPEVAPRVLLSCMLAEGALVLGAHMGRTVLFEAVGAVVTALQSSGVPASNVAKWVAANDATAHVFEWRLIVMWSAAFVALLFTRHSAAAMSIPEPAAPVVVPASAPPEGLIQPIVRAPAMTRRPVDSPFDRSNYLIRARQRWNPLVRRYAEYDITSIPPMSSVRFEFSWHTGQLTRAADGALILTIDPARAPALWWNRPYAVADGARAPLGTLVPAGADWTIKLASGDGDVYVLRGRADIAFARFVASRDEHELCRFTWTIEKTMGSAELEIEFTPDAEPALRLMAVALAPILELRSRLRSERQHH
jgi:hypothetical protein